MINPEKLSLTQKIHLKVISYQMYKYGHNHQNSGNGYWYKKRLNKLIDRQKMLINPKYIGWGWKEPNSHLIVNSFTKYFKDFKYIHTIRHGLDMAFSKNQQQLYNWGTIFNVDLPENASQEPRASLDYWIKANENIFNLQKVLGSDKILIINFDNICSNPQEEVRKILSFLNYSCDEKTFNELINLPKTPSSTGRYKTKNLSDFTTKDIAILKKFGFEFSSKNK